MKKTYTKPVLMMDDFTLSQSIAHNCGDNIKPMWSNATLKYHNTCGWNTQLDGDLDGQDDIIFISGNQNCKVETEGEAFGVCYNNPQGGFNVFNS